MSANVINPNKIHRFYICRHGETDANESGVIQGSSDFSRLTMKGKEQARNLGQTLSFSDAVVMNHVFLSPLNRAQETWNILRQSMIKSDGNGETKICQREIVLSNLREIDFYSWEGLHKNEIKARFPTSYQAWKIGDPEGLSVEAESDVIKYPLKDLWDRASEVWNEIHERELNYLLESKMTTEHSSSLLVCHGSLGQALLGTALGADANFFRKEEFPNCGMVEIEWVLHSKESFGKVHRWRWYRPTVGEWNYHN